jgi:thymidine phosphorylase
MIIGATTAAERCRRLIEAQGGNPAVLDDPAALPQAPVSAVWDAPRAGYVTRVAPRAIGEAIIALGGGRRRVDDEIDPSVGFVITAKPGDRVERGEPLATVYARDDAGLALGRGALDGAITIGDESPGDVLPLVGAVR